VPPLYEGYVSWSKSFTEQKSIEKAELNYEAITKILEEYSGYDLVENKLNSLALALKLCLLLRQRVVNCIWADQLSNGI